MREAAVIAIVAALGLAGWNGASHGAWIAAVGCWGVAAVVVGAIVRVIASDPLDDLDDD